MNIKRREHIYDSKAEWNAFQQLQQQWGTQFDIYLHVPLPNLIEIENPKAELSSGESQTYFGSSVDFTIVEKGTGNILLSVDFDGLGEGYGEGASYIGKPTKDPYRQLKLEAKLKWAALCKYPYLVISQREFKGAAAGVEFPVVDGLIGSILVRKYTDKFIDEELAAQRDRLANAPDHETGQAIFEDICAAAETKCEFAYNRISARTYKMIGELLLAGHNVAHVNGGRGK